jgi:hypothetical protein
MPLHGGHHRQVHLLLAVREPGRAPHRAVLPHLGTRLAPHPVQGRGLHSFTLQLNLSGFYGIGGARMDCVARVKGVLGVVWVV